MKSRRRRNGRIGLGLAILVSAALACGPASAADYISPSGYLQVIGYRLVRRASHDGADVVYLAGRVEALADCDGATVVFDVFDRAGRKVGEVRLDHGPLYRHDVWPLGRGELVPVAGTKLEAAVAGAEHVIVREADCSRRW